MPHNIRISLCAVLIRKYFAYLHVKVFKSGRSIPIAILPPQAFGDIEPHRIPIKKEMAMASHIPNIQLLQASVDENDESEFRLLVDSKFVKYTTIDHGLYEVDDMCFGPSLTTMLPALPSDSWNTGHISKNPADGRPYFASATMTRLPEISHIWHPLQFDHLDFEMGKSLRSNVYEASTRHFDSTVVVKFARFPWEISLLDQETLAYKWVDGHEIGPKFLGHLTEEGRVIGFVMELILNFRHATPDDIGLCQLALSKLHGLGIKHGDMNKHNILIHDEKATLIDFDVAVVCDDKKVLEEEFQSLKCQLEETSGRGGIIRVE